MYSPLWGHPSPLSIYRVHLEAHGEIWGPGVACAPQTLPAQKELRSLGFMGKGQNNDMVYRRSLLAVGGEPSLVSQFSHSVVPFYNKKPEGRDRANRHVREPESHFSCVSTESARQGFVKIIFKIIISLHLYWFSPPPPNTQIKRLLGLIVSCQLAWNTLCCRSGWSLTDRSTRLFLYLPSLPQPRPPLPGCG